MKKIRGFTLIELMIVVGIIGILSMLAFPSYQNYMLKVRIANFINDAVMPFKSLAQEKIVEGYSPSSEGNVIQATTSKTAGMFKSATVRFVMSSAVGKDKKGRADTYMVEAVLAPAHFLKNGSDTSIGFRMYAISNESQINI